KKVRKMKYINYKKNDLKQIQISDLKITLPDLKNIGKTQTIANRLMEWIDDSIKKKTITYGYLLPSKAELAYAFGVSLGTIQNVLRMLEDKNYIHSKQCIGSIIKDRTDNELEIRKRTSKKDIAEKKIKNYIIVNKLGVNDVMPVSRQLAREINMTLNTVRCAVSTLITDNILEYNDKKDLIVKSVEFIIDENADEETLVNKVKSDLKRYICKNFKIGDKLPAHDYLAKEFNVSMKTIHNAVQLLVKENMLLPRRGSYGTIITNISMNASMEPRREMSIFAPAQETAFYHYQKIQNRIKNIISERYDIGSKLPSINEFSKMLDISPNTIRKALNNLANDGILRFTRGRYGGTYVIDMPETAEQTFKWLAVNPQYAKSVL
ncbi:MAG: GntR family transcriptional regulator, partial [Candidatus Gastranaerophilales bacterium]|nr:GntR family transcriptional regulator [Candidatus Gastranaerophilales bacterium]